MRDFPADLIDRRERSSEYRGNGRGHQSDSQRWAANLARHFHDFFLLTDRVLLCDELM